MKTLCFTLDLKNNDELIREYLDHHQKVWPEVLESITDSGILSMEIYHFGTRLFMRIEVSDHFSLEMKAQMDADNPKVQEWERLMWKYQSSVTGSRTDEKWVLMTKIFDLNETSK